LFLSSELFLLLGAGLVLGLKTSLLLLLFSERLLLLLKSCKSSGDLLLLATGSGRGGFGCRRSDFDGFRLGGFGFRLRRTGYLLLRSLEIMSVSRKNPVALV
jgi:hypothetical protein